MLRFHHITEFLLESNFMPGAPRSECALAESYPNNWYHIKFSIYASTGLSALTHWGRVSHICVGKLTIIGSDNGLSPGRRQAIIWTNAGILLIGPLERKFSEILIEIQTFSLKRIYLKMSSTKCCPIRLGLSALSEGRWSSLPKYMSMDFLLSDR